jgi:hypothetical protein
VLLVVSSGEDLQCLKKLALWIFTLSPARLMLQQVPSEIHTNQTRTATMCGTVFVNFIASFIIGQCFNQMLCSMQYAVFFFFAGWLAIMTVWVAICLPETKGIAVETVMDAWATYATFPPCHYISLHCTVAICTVSKTGKKEMKDLPDADVWATVCSCPCLAASLQMRRSCRAYVGKPQKCDMSCSGVRRF